METYITVIQLKDIQFGDKVKSIGNKAFYECTGLTSVILPNNIISIGESSFQNCSNLLSVTSEITEPFSIDEYVFYGISPNAVLYVPKNTKSIYQAFSGWVKNFKEVIEESDPLTTYSLSIKATGNRFAVYDETTVRNGTSTYNVTEGTNATITLKPDNGYRIKSVKVNSTNVTSSVTNNQYTISNITTDTSVEVEFETITSFEVDGIMFNIIPNTNNHVEITSKEGGYTGTLNIPESVIFQGNTYFVTSIGTSAFQNCKDLTGSLVIPNTVTSIGNCAFDFCSGLTGLLSIPNSVISIGNYAFSRCSGLTGALAIPNSVTSIGEYAFWGCSGFNGSLTIPNSVTSINVYTFCGCSGLTGPLTIPNSVTNIGREAFSGCRNLSGALTIPNSVTNVGSSAFYSCSRFRP